MFGNIEKYLIALRMENTLVILLLQWSNLENMDNSHV